MTGIRSAMPMLGRKTSLTENEHNDCNLPQHMSSLFGLPLLSNIHIRF